MRRSAVEGLPPGREQAVADIAAAGGLRVASTAPSRPAQCWIGPPPPRGTGGAGNGPRYPARSPQGSGQCTRQQPGRASGLRAGASATRGPQRGGAGLLDGQLNPKTGQSISLINAPYAIAAGTPRVAADTADAMLLSAANRAELDRHVGGLRGAAQRGAMVWPAYPQGRQLGTDLTRNILHAHMPPVGLDIVRQVASDTTWSALRFRPCPPRLGPD